MPYKSELINVRVSRGSRILWIGAEAYPLQNIARARSVKLAPDRKAAVRLYLKAVVPCLILGIAAKIVLAKFPAIPSSAVNAFHGAEIAVVALAAISTIRLLARLFTRTYYALVIETAGTPYAAVTCTDESTITNLVRKITKAIDDPQEQFSYTVNNIHNGDKIGGDKIGGDKIRVSGSQNTGKVFQ